MSFCWTGTPLCHCEDIDTKKGKMCGPWLKHLGYSGNLWESLGISLELWNYYCSFSWTAQTTLWMLLTVTWHAHTDQCVCVCVLCVSVCVVRVCITCKHVYSSCIMCSMFVISTKQTDKQTAVRSLHIHILHRWDAGFQCVTQASCQRYTSLSQ